MASKRIETVKSHNQGGVVSITQNVDPAISIQELIKTGLEHYRTGKTGQFTKNSSSKQPPPTFNVKPSPKSSRNNSLGRKPHESGSDDSFVDSGAGGSVGGSSRPTHSPASVSGFHPYPQPPRIEHHKMTSDPGFYHTMPDYHASAPGPASGPVPGQTAPRYTAGLPPVPHGRTSHGSAHSVATSPHQVMQSPQPAPMMQPFHQQSRSLEVMTAAHSHDALAYDSSVPTVAGAPAGYYPDNKPSSHQAGGGAGGWHQRTVSLDPMIMASHSSGIASPHANDSTGSAHSLGQYSAAAAADSSYGPLPEGWSTGLDPSGTLYFIDHNTKKTTWLDPRLPSKHQEQMLKSRMQQYPHQRQASTPQLQQPQYYPQQPPQVAPTTNPPAPYVQGSQTADYAYSDASHRNKMNQLSMETKYMHERQKELYEIGLLQPQQMSSQYSSSSMGPPNVQHQQQQQQHGYGTGGGYGTSSSGFNMQQQPSSVDAMEVDYAQIPQNHGGYGGQHHHAPHNAYQPSVRQEFFQDINPQEFERYLYIEQK